MLIERHILKQTCFIGFKVFLHTFDSAHLSPAHLSRVPKQLVVNQYFAKVDDLNMEAVLGLPDLALC